MTDRSSNRCLAGVSSWSNPCTDRSSIDADTSWGRSSIETDPPPDPPAIVSRSPRVRYPNNGESAVLYRLQRQLDDPSPSLLEYGLTASGTAGGDVLVSVATTGDGATVPVGYLLYVDGPATRHLVELVVDRASRREGRGRELLSIAVGTTDTPVTLLVAADNEPARSLYRSYGFTVVERLPEAYDDGVGLRYRYDPTS